MLSRLIPPVALNDKTFTGTISKKMKTPAPGDPMKLHIPELMTKISSGDPKISTVHVKGTTILKNAPECKPLLKTTLKTQNYLTLDCAKNTNWDGIDKVTLGASGRIVYRELKSGTTVNAEFLGGLSSHGIVETSRDSSYIDDKNTSNLYSGDMGHIHVTDPEQIGVLSSHVDNLISHLQDSKILGEK